MIQKELEKRLEEMEIRGNIKTKQTKAVLWLAGILRIVPETWEVLLSLRHQSKTIW